MQNFFRKPKPNYFYYDANGQKQLVSEQQLKKLAAQGVIGADTLIETPAGYKGTAIDIPGLFDDDPFNQMEFYYFDQTRKKQGPIRRLELEKLVTRGIIGRHTRIETASGEGGTAEKLFPHLFQSRLIDPTKGDKVIDSAKYAGSWLVSMFNRVMSLVAGIGVAGFILLLTLILGITIVIGSFCFRVAWSLMFP